MSGATELATASDGPSQDGGLVVERHDQYSATCKWTVPRANDSRSRALWSKYFEVGGFDCRLLLYPKGDSQALPGYLSIYLQVTDPGGNSSKWDCFASYRLAVENQRDSTRSVVRDSWHRFSAKKKSHGWCDFTPSDQVFSKKDGFMVGDSIVVSAQILILAEHASFVKDDTMAVGASATSGEVLSGKFTWRVHNFPLFQEMIRTQKIMSPLFPASECNLRLSVYQSVVAGSDHLSMCLESKDGERANVPEKTCWCLFRMTVHNQEDPKKHMHRDSYGRFTSDSASGDNSSLGWNDYMPMSQFLDPSLGYLVGQTAVFAASFHIIKETCNFLRVAPSLGPPGSTRAKAKLVAGGETFQGKFMWRVENFNKLKDILKKRKITGLCIKSRRFQVGGRDCRLIVYPRGQSQPPMHLSMFLEVTDSRCTTQDWSCFVSHKLAVVNQKAEGGKSDVHQSVVKESQNRYSRTAKDWGWREFITLTQLFDQDAGLLLNNTVVFSAEVQILKESSSVDEVQRAVYFADNPAQATRPSLPPTFGGDRDLPPPQSPSLGPVVVFTWRVENFTAFKDIMETRKIFSRYFPAGGCELRLGVYESFDTLCVYLESDAAAAGAGAGQQGGAAAPPEGALGNYWLRYRIGLVNHKNSEKTLWKESSICTRNWNNSVLQFVRVPEMVDPKRGFLSKDSVHFQCEVIEVHPWEECFSDLASEDDAIGEGAGPGVHDDAGGVSSSAHACGVAAAMLAGPSAPSAVAAVLEGGVAAAAAAHGGAGARRQSEPIGKEDLLQQLFAKAGLQGGGDSPVLDPKALQTTLRDKILMDTSAVASFLAGLRVYLDDPSKVQRLLMPGVAQEGGGAGGAVAAGGKKAGGGGGGAGADGQSPLNLMNLLVGVKMLQHAIVDLLLDIMVECCLDAQNSARVMSAMQQEAGDGAGPRDGDAGGSDDGTSDDSSAGGEGASELAQRLAADAASPGQQSETLLRLIIHSLRTLDTYAVQASQLPLPPRAPRPPMAHRLASLLQSAPRSLLSDILLLVPKLVDASEHGQAARCLCEWLASGDHELADSPKTTPAAEFADAANGDGRAASGSEDGLIVEVGASSVAATMGALSQLTLSAEAAETTMRAALDAMTALEGQELSVAVALVLKLSSQHPSLAALGVPSLLRELSRGAADRPGAEEGMRLLRMAVSHHADIAHALLTSVADSMGAMVGPSTDAGAAPAPEHRGDTGNDCRDEDADASPMPAEPESPRVVPESPAPATPSRRAGGEPLRLSESGDANADDEAPASVAPDSGDGALPRGSVDLILDALSQGPGTLPAALRAVEAAVLAGALSETAMVEALRAATDESATDLQAANADQDAAGDGAGAPGPAADAHQDSLLTIAALPGFPIGTSATGVQGLAGSTLPGKAGGGKAGVAGLRNEEETAAMVALRALGASLGVGDGSGSSRPEDEDGAGDGGDGDGDGDWEGSGSEAEPEGTWPLAADGALQGDAAGVGGDATGASPLPPRVVGVLRLAESLVASRDDRLQRFGAAIYGALSDGAAAPAQREAVRSLVNLAMTAATMAALQPASPGGVDTHAQIEASRSVLARVATAVPGCTALVAGLCCEHMSAMAANLRRVHETMRSSVQACEDRIASLTERVDAEAAGRREATEACAKLEAEVDKLHKLQERSDKARHEKVSSLESKAGELEKQVDWLRNEKQDMASRAGAESKDMRERMKELERQAAKQQQARAKEVQKLTRERQQAEDRARSLQSQLDKVHRVHEEDTRRLEREKRDREDLLRKLKAAEAKAKELAEEKADAEKKGAQAAQAAAQHQARAAEHERAAKAAQQQVRALEGRFEGPALERLPREELQALLDRSAFIVSRASAALGRPLQAVPVGAGGGVVQPPPPPPPSGARRAAAAAARGRGDRSPVKRGSGAGGPYAAAAAGAAVPPPPPRRRPWR
ncbi:unnamed protein product [Pedinophyceae sp. YPF-701]|nr:unnamed protein product [Pedinophyceae sp. YPF-701]